MKTEPKVSIILPIFDRPNFTKKTLNAVYKQSYKNFEIIVVNDNPSLDFDVSGYKKLKYLKNNKNLGPAASRNKGISAASGDLIFLLDDDIILSKNYIKILVGTLLRYKMQNVAAVTGRLLYPQKTNDEVINKPLFELSRYTGDVTLRASIDTKKVLFVPVVHSCSIFWKSIFNHIKFDERRYIGNYTYVEPDFCFRLTKAGFRLLYQPKAIADHYQIKESGCRYMSPLKYKYFTARNALFFLMRFYNLKTIYMYPLFLIKRLLLKL